MFDEQSKFVHLLLCWVLVFAALIGCVYSLRVTLAQIFYYEAKYGVSKDCIDGIIWRAEKIKSLYPWHYLAFTHAAARANKEAKDNPERMIEMKDIANRFCTLSLRLNPYKRQMRLMEARLISEKNTLLAVDKWKSYLEWAFWDPLNHKIMVEFYLKAGDFASAMESLEFTLNSPYYEECRNMIRDFWEKEKTFSY